MIPLPVTHSLFGERHTKIIQRPTSQCKIIFLPESIAWIAHLDFQVHVGEAQSAMNGKLPARHSHCTDGTIGCLKCQQGTVYWMDDAIRFFKYQHSTVYWIDSIVRCFKWQRGTVFWWTAQLDGSNFSEAQSLMDCTGRCFKWQHSTV